VNKLLYTYPLQVTLVQQNLFDSHDTDRIASMFVNPDRPYDGQNRLQDNAAEVGYSKRAPNDVEWARFRQIVAFQMTFVGAPMIYYGNEAGMFSPDDPSNRMPFWWKDVGTFDNADFGFNDAIFAWHQKLIALRNRFEALRTGTLRMIQSDDATGVVSFVREHGQSRVWVVINRSEKPAEVVLPVANGVKLFDYLDDSAKVTFNDDGAAARPTIAVRADASPLENTQGTIKVKLSPYGTAVLAEK
jgi:glycosidase